MASAQDSSAEPGSAEPAADRLRRPPNIVIMALAKTGSTGLYNSVKAALARSGHDYYFLFEPTRATQLRSICRYAPRIPLLTKAMIARDADLDVPYDHFAKRVTLLRDPRDMIVSFLLFRPFVRADIPYEQVEPFVEAIKEKERDPSSRSLQSLHVLADQLGLAAFPLERVVQHMERQESLIDHNDMFTVRYEDFIVGRLDPLNDYLGFAVENGTTASPWLNHILRAAGTGDWRHWLTKSDIVLYRPFLAPYMRRFVYEDDWELAEQPAIDPSTASRYLEGKYRQRYAQQEQRRNNLALDLDLPEQRARLAQVAEDGDANAMYCLAKALVDSDERAAFRLTQRAAAQGHRPAMRQLAVLYRKGRGVEPDPEQAAFWKGEAEETAGGTGR